MVFINANGLFVKDRIRPAIQALINLVISIVLVKAIGISGVFIGTLVSVILTSWWRQPVLVYKYVFNDKKIFKYFAQFIIFGLLTLTITGLLKSLIDLIPNTVLGFLGKVIICCVIPNIVFVCIFIKNECFQYYMFLIKDLFNKKVSFK
jgi:hypothetical protein